MTTCRSLGSRATRAWRRRPIFALLLLASAALPAAQARAADDAAQTSRLEAELRETKEELALTRDALRALSRKVDALEAAQPAGAPQTAPGATARLAPVNADNPAISFVVDTLAYSNSEADPVPNTANVGNGFDLQSGELFISAPIDPFLRGYATISASSVEGFDVEEAALVTTGLPWNLLVRGGRFFADVGRFSSYHPEALPFVDRPPSLERIVGGESQAEGAELSWLLPTPFFASLTFGAYNAVGAERIEEPEEFGFPVGTRSFSELTYLVRPLTYLDITDDINLEFGGTYLFIPRNQDRGLYGLDLTLRYQPALQGFYQGTTIGSEWLWNSERFPDVNPVLDPATGLPLLDDAGEPVLGPARFVRNGGYVYAESFFARRFSVGARFDYSELVSGQADRLRTTSAFLTWMPSEYQRLRFQFDHFSGKSVSNQRYTLQWTAFIGSHSHGFANRAR